MKKYFCTVETHTHTHTHTHTDTMNFRDSGLGDFSTLQVPEAKFYWPEVVNLVWVSGKVNKNLMRRFWKQENHRKADIIHSLADY